MTNSAFWTQGEVQAGRVLPGPHALERSHAQTLIFPPPVVEARLRVGLIPGEDHLRWQWEFLDPQQSELLAMRSVPHRRASEVGWWPTQIGRDYEELLLPILDPDPF